MAGSFPPLPGAGTQPGYGITSGPHASTPDLPPFLPPGPQRVTLPPAVVTAPNLTDSQIHGSTVDCSVGGWEQQLSCSAGQLAQKIIANLGLLALAGAGVYLVFRPQINDAVKTGVKAAALA